MQEVVHDVFGDRPIGGEKLVADVQIRHDAAASLERSQALIHGLDRGAVGIGLLAARKDAQQQNAARG